MNFFVPAGPLGHALFLLAAQADMQIIFVQEQLQNYQAAEFSCADCSLDYALRAMLAGTPLTFSYYDEYDDVQEDLVAVCATCQQVCRPELGAQAPLPPCITAEAHPPRNPPERDSEQ